MNSMSPRKSPLLESIIQLQVPDKDEKEQRLTKLIARPLLHKRDIQAPADLPPYNIVLQAIEAAGVYFFKLTEESHPHLAHKKWFAGLGWYFVDMRYDDCPWGAAPTLKDIKIIAYIFLNLGENNSETDISEEALESVWRGEKQ